MFKLCKKYTELCRFYALKKNKKILFNTKSIENSVLKPNLKNENRKKYWSLLENFIIIGLKN